WTRTNSTNVTGIAASGTTSSISGVLVSKTSVQSTVFTVKATDGIGCTSTTQVTLNVKPAPTVAAAPLTQTITTGSSSAEIAVSNPNALPGTSLSWTRNNTGTITGLNASGTGNIP